MRWYVRAGATVVLLTLLLLIILTLPPTQLLILSTTVPDLTPLCHELTRAVRERDAEKFVVLVQRLEELRVPPYLTYLSTCHQILQVLEGLCRHRKYVTQLLTLYRFSDEVLEERRFSELRKVCVLAQKLLTSREYQVLRQLAEEGVHTPYTPLRNLCTELLLLLDTLPVLTKLSTTPQELRVLWEGAEYRYRDEG